MIDVKMLFPHFYDDILEMDLIKNVDEALLSELSQNIEEVEMNSFLVTAKESGIEKYEKLFKIVADPINESLNFRRKRVINRISNRPPYTLEFLAEKIKAFLGEENVNVYMDYDTYTLYVEASAANQAGQKEITATINMIKPANIVYVNKPLITDTISIGERIEGYGTLNNYKINYWKLGENSFQSEQLIGVLKMAGIESIAEDLLKDIAGYTVSDVADVLINDIFIISSFSVKAASNNTVIVEYIVPEDAGIAEITSIKLRNAAGNILSNADIYVPVTTDVSLKHIFTIQEGA